MPHLLIVFIIFVVVACIGWLIVNWTMGFTEVTGKPRQIIIGVYILICLCILIFEFLIPLLGGISTRA